MTLQHRRILLGVTGSIAAYKACELVRLLVREEADVQVVMTPAAERFVQALTFEALSRRPVRTELFDRDAEMAMSHIELARWADAVLIAPASADCLARLATGAADDLLATLCLAARAPIAVAPAMNAAMWDHPATQAHVRTLRERGLKVIEPDIGDQACGDTGPGRLPEPAQLRAELEELCAERNMQGLAAIVTAGPTREAIDPARFLSNFSTGRMGCAVAEALLQRGARVTLVHGPAASAAARRRRTRARHHRRRHARRRHGAHQGLPSAGRRGRCRGLAPQGPRPPRRSGSAPARRRWNWNPPPTCSPTSGACPTGPIWSASPPKPAT